MSWYRNIKNEILTCTPVTNATNATKRQNVANVANVARGESENSTTQGYDFCPLNFLLEHDVGIMNIDPTNGIILATGYSCTQELRHRIEFWTLGYFDRLLAALGEKRAITKKVHCISLNRYKLPKA